jgi:predicted ArsR family transcriptional regulator
MAKVNCKQVAERLGVSYVVAAGLVKHLVATGKATIVEKVFHESGKGKPVRFYEIEDGVSLDLSGSTLAVTEAVEAVAETVTEGAAEAA